MTRCGAVTPLVPRYIASTALGQPERIFYGNSKPSPWAAGGWVKGAGYWCADHCHIIGADDLGSVTVSQ